MEEVITQLEDIDCENKDLEDFIQLFDLEPATNLPELLFVDETTLTNSSKMMCNKCGKIF